MSALLVAFQSGTEKRLFWKLNILMEIVKTLIQTMFACYVRIAIRRLIHIKVKMLVTDAMQEGFVTKKVNRIEPKIIRAMRVVGTKHSFGLCI